MNKAYTVLLLCPDYLDQSGNGYSGTFQSHVYGFSPEEAIDRARYEARAASYSVESDYDLPPVTDWGFVAVFLGHLDNLYTP